MKNMTLAVLFGNRGFFPESLIAGAREEVAAAVKAAGYDYIIPDADMTRYGAVELSRYYRSMHGELIEFSNRAFYSSGMEIAPSPRISREMPPIARYKVSGEWQEGRNYAEAKKVEAKINTLI